jgi:acyl carrier protein
VSELTVSRVVDVVIALLAEVRQERPENVRAALEVVGSQLPIDSLLIVEILARVEETCGVRIPADPESARSMRSVTTFAQAVVAAGQAAARREDKA